jgi:hypothetical protein
VFVDRLIGAAWAMVGMSTEPAMSPTAALVSAARRNEDLVSLTVASLDLDRPRLVSSNVPLADVIHKRRSIRDP